VTATRSPAANGKKQLAAGGEFGLGLKRVKIVNLGQPCDLLFGV